MARILTGTQVHEIMAECRINGELLEYVEGSEHFGQMPSPLGWGYGRVIQLRSGLWLDVYDLKKRQAHTYQIQHDSTQPLTLIFYLSGGIKVNNNGLKMDQEEVAGTSYFYCLPSTHEIEEYPAEQRICAVKIRISPELIFSLSDRIDDFPISLITAINHPKKAALYAPTKITPAQQHVLQQILQWPYHGIARKLYLEGKVLELLALQFNKMLTSPISQLKPLIAKDIDRIYQARDILVQNMTSPPSLLELAKQVHLNERKLKEGFRQVFDTTVFGFLHDYRMEQARQLLETGQLNVQETARWVGYASRSSFVVAFKKKFQTTPSQYFKGAG